jgi:hypothetical protein
MRLDNFAIDPSKPAHLEWWAEYFEISERDLLTAIDAVGVQALDVQCYLQLAAPQYGASAIKGEEEQR